jgi:hypothetical protein
LRLEFFDEGFAFDFYYRADHARRAFVERDAHFIFKLRMEQAVETFRHCIGRNLVLAETEAHVRLAKNCPESQPGVGLFFRLTGVCDEHW